MKDRINRRITKVDITSTLVLGGNFNIYKTIYKYEDITYIPKYIRITKEEVDIVIIPLLYTADGVIRNRLGSPSKRISNYYSRSSEVNIATNSYTSSF